MITKTEMVHHGTVIITGPEDALTDVAVSLRDANYKVSRSTSSRLCLDDVTQPELDAIMPSLEKAGCVVAEARGSGVRTFFMHEKRRRASLKVKPGIWYFAEYLEDTTPFVLIRKIRADPTPDGRKNNVVEAEFLTADNATPHKMLVGAEELAEYGLRVATKDDFEDAGLPIPAILNTVVVTSAKVEADYRKYDPERVTYLLHLDPEEVEAQMAATVYKDFSDYEDLEGEYAQFVANAVREGTGLGGVHVRFGDSVNDEVIDYRLEDLQGDDFYKHLTTLLVDGNAVGGGHWSEELGSQRVAGHHYPVDDYKEHLSGMLSETEYIPWLVNAFMKSVPGPDDLLFREYLVEKGYELSPDARWSGEAPASPTAKVAKQPKKAATTVNVWKDGTIQVKTDDEPDGEVVVNTPNHQAQANFQRKAGAHPMKRQAADNLSWPVYQSEEIQEREQVENVFGLGGGELEDASWGGHKYWYEGPPEYAEEFDGNDINFEYRTVIGFRFNPDEKIVDEDGSEWALKGSFMSSGESDCWVCGSGGNGKEWWAEEFQKEHGRVPTDTDECGLCEYAYKDMPGYVYIGDAYEAVYMKTEEAEEEEEDEYNEASARRKANGRWAPGARGDLKEFLQKGVILRAGEGTIDLGDEDEIQLAVIFQMEGYGPHNGAIFVDQNRYHASPDSALQSAAEVFNEWRLNSDFYADHIKDLQAEWGDRWMEILEETDDAAMWTLSPAEAAAAIRGTDAEQFIDIDEAEEEDEDYYEASTRRTAYDTGAFYDKYMKYTDIEAVGYSLWLISITDGLGGPASGYTPGFLPPEAAIAIGDLSPTSPLGTEIMKLIMDIDAAGAEQVLVTQDEDDIFTEQMNTLIRDIADLVKTKYPEYLRQASARRTAETVEEAAYNLWRVSLTDGLGGPGGGRGPLAPDVAVGVGGVSTDAPLGRDILAIIRDTEHAYVQQAAREEDEDLKEEIFAELMGMFVRDVADLVRTKYPRYMQASVHQANLYHQESALEILRAGAHPDDVATWDSHVVDHINYAEAYEGPVDDLEFMAGKLGDDDMNTAFEIVNAFNLQEDVQPYEDGDDPLAVWEEVIQALAKNGYATFATPKNLPGGGYNLGVMNDDFGFIFTADEETVGIIKEQAFGPDDPEEYEEWERSQASIRQALSQRVARSMLDSIIDQKDVLSTMDQLEADKQSRDLFYEVYKHFVDKFDLEQNEQSAFNRMLSVIENHALWDPSLLRNNIFKAANSLGMELPSGMF